VRPNLSDTPTHDNLVSDLLGPATMPPAAGTVSRKETAASMLDIVSRHNRLEEIMRTLTAKVGDVDEV
jgi:hypothetical protein